MATHSPGKMVLTYKKRRASPSGDALPREDGGLEDAGEGALQLLDRLLDQLTEGVLDVLRPRTQKVLRKGDRTQEERTMQVNCTVEIIGTGKGKYRRRRRGKPGGLLGDWEKEIAGGGGGRGERKNMRGRGRKGQGEEGKAWGEGGKGRGEEGNVRFMEGKALNEEGHCWGVARV